MLAFPQLSTGASAVYPVTKRFVTKTAVNILADGSKDLVADPDGSVTTWELRAMGLTRVEWNAIEALFQQTCGRWGSFTFLDPLGNLLVQSETLTDSVWAKGALLQLTVGIADPLGGSRATRVVNAGQASAAVEQTLAVPGGYQYCMSVWARSATGSRVSLAIAGASKSFALTEQWRRIFATVNPEQPGAETVTFGAHLDAAETVDLFGMQAEAQLGPSDYKPTGARGGVYSRARFDTDHMTVTARSTDVHDAVVRIVSTES